MAQHDWMTANPGKVITVHDLAALTNAPYQASFTVKNIVAAFTAAVFLGLAKIASHKTMCVHSQNVDQDVTEDRGGRLSLAFQLTRQ